MTKLEIKIILDDFRAKRERSPKKLYEAYNSFAAIPRPVSDCGSCWRKIMAEIEQYLNN